MKPFQIRRPRGVLWSVTRTSFASLALVGSTPLYAHAACSDAPWECFGAAGAFKLVTQGMAKLGAARVTDGPGGGFPTWTATTVSGDVCAERVSAVSPPPNAISDLKTNADAVAALADSGVGVVATTAGAQSLDEVGLDAGTVATGGSLVGPRVQASTIDTTGSHPLVVSCQEAYPDALAATAYFEGLPSNGQLGHLHLADDEVRTIALSAGGNVLDADSVRLGKGSRLGWSGGASWVVIRTPKLKASTAADIDYGPAYVLFVLAGRGPSVSVGRFSDLQGVRILAPERNATFLGEASVQGLWVKKATLRGVDLL